MSEKEKELEARERALAEREKEVERREKALDPFSLAVKIKKESLYDMMKVSVRTMDIIIGVTVALLAVVVVLIILEATGVFKL